jgi:PAS domain S-box-containing protein
MVLLIDESLRIIQANKPLLAFLSVPEEEIAGSYVYDGPCSLFCSDVLTGQIRLGLSGETVHGRLRLFHGNDECYLDQRIYPMALPDGRPGVCVVFDDVTDQVHAETALEQSEAMFRQLVETIQDAVWSLDETFVIRYISPQIARICGYSAEELIGRRFSEFMPEGAALRFSWELSSGISQSHGFTLIDFPFTGKDGKRIYCEFSGMPVYLEEDPEVFLGYSGAVRNVTERRNAEQGVKRWKLFLDAVMDNIPGPILVTDRKTGRVVYFNYPAERLFRKTRSELQEMTAPALFDFLQAGRLADAYSAAVAFGSAATVAEERIGTLETYVSARILPMVLSADRAYLLTILSDISADIADRNRQLQTRELAFVLEGVSAVSELWQPILDLLPAISGFEAVAVYQRSIFDDYVLYTSKGGHFAPAVQGNAILDRIIRKGEPAIFDKHRMNLFPEGTLTVMENAKSLVLMPVVHESRTVACLILGSTSAKLPDTVLRGILISTAFQISTVASRCLVQEKLQRERDRTKSYLDLAGVLLAAVRRDGIIEMINSYGADLLGYADADLPGQNWFDCFVPSDVRQEQMERFEKLVSGQSGDTVFQGYILLSDGTRKLFRWRTSLLREECGSVSAVVLSGEPVCITSASDG